MWIEGKLGSREIQLGDPEMSKEVIVVSFGQGNGCLHEMASREIKTTIRLLIKAGQAKPAPPVGPSLGQAGLNIMQFCKDFNAKTANYKVGRGNA